MKQKGYFFPENRRGQIWVETVIYTLIAFALIGLVLGFVRPKIQEIQDEGVIEQSIEIVQEMDLVIRNLGGPGNQRVIEIGISKGALNIDGTNDRIFFEVESRHAYSQPGEDVGIGNIVARTESVGDLFDVNLTRSLSDSYNITFQGRDDLRRLSQASTPYRILITDKGLDSGSRTIVDVEVI